MSAQLNPPVLYESSAPNFAPLAPIVAQIQGTTNIRESTVQEALKEKLKWHLGVEKKVWDELYLNGYEIANFIEGRQFIRPNPWAPGTYLAYVPRTNNESNKRTLNLMRFYASNALWKWQLSNPDIVAVAGIDTEPAREAAKAADLIIEHYEREFFKPQTTIQEALHGLCWGTYIWRIRYDDSQKVFSAQVPLYSDQQVSVGQGYGQCADCGVQGTAQDFPPDETGEPACPECGGPAQVQQATGTVPSVTGTQQVDLGDIRAELLPLPECKWDLNRRAHESSWFIHQRKGSALSIRRLIGNIRLPTFDDANGFGNTVIERLAYSGQSGGGQARADYKKVQLHKEPVMIVEYSLGPDDISDIYIVQDEETVDGQVIPAGPLLATFPNGLTVQGLNGLNLITGIYAEHHSESIVQGVWHSRVTGGTGQGFDDLREVQKRFNADDSQVHTFLRATGTPALIFRQEAIGDQDRQDYMGDPHMNIAVNSQNLPENTRLEDVVRPAFQPQSVPGQLFQYTYDRLNDFAQLTSHITDFSGGLPNVNNRTATGAQISQANSNALFTPPLQVKGEVRACIAEIVLTLYRKHFPLDRYFPLKGQYGRQQGRYLNGADIDTNIRLEVVKDSELPKNAFTKREDYTQFFTILGGAAGYAALAQQFPELAEDIEQKFNIQLNSDTYDHIASLCQQRIQQMMDISQLVPVPEMLLMAINPPIAMEEPNHDKKAKYLSEWLDNDEGQTALPPLRQAVILLIQEHFQMFAVQMSEIAFQQGAIATAGAMPGAVGGAVGNSVNNQMNPQPDTSPTDPNKRGPITGRPAPKGGGK